MNDRIEVTEVCFLFLHSLYVMVGSMSPPPPSSYVGVLILNVTVFGDGAFMEVIKGK